MDGEEASGDVAVVAMDDYVNTIEMDHAQPTVISLAETNTTTTTQPNGEQIIVMDTGSLGDQFVEVQYADGSTESVVIQGAGGDQASVLNQMQMVEQVAEYQEVGHEGVPQVLHTSMGGPLGGSVAYYTTTEDGHMAIHTAEVSSDGELIKMDMEGGQGVDLVTEEVIGEEEEVGEDEITGESGHYLQGEGDSQILVIEQESGEILIIQKEGAGDSEETRVLTEEILQKAGYATVSSVPATTQEAEDLIADSTVTEVIGGNRPAVKRKKPIMVGDKTWEDGIKPVRPIERQKMRPWLIDLLDRQELAGLSWQNKRDRIFRISWKHAAHNCFNKDRDSDLFERWAIHTGRYSTGNHKKWKANFRCALNSLPDVIELRDLGVKKGDNAFKVYKFLDPSDPAYKDRMENKGKKGPSLKYTYSEENGVTTIKTTPKSSKVKTELKLMPLKDFQGKAVGEEGSTLQTLLKAIELQTEQKDVGGQSLKHSMTDGATISSSAAKHMRQDEDGNIILPGNIILKMDTDQDGSQGPRIMAVGSMATAAMPTSVSSPEVKDSPKVGMATMAKIPYIGAIDPKTGKVTLLKVDKEEITTATSALEKELNKEKVGNVSVGTQVTNVTTATSSPIKNLTISSPVKILTQPLMSAGTSVAKTTTSSPKGIPITSPVRIGPVNKVTAPPFTQTAGPQPLQTIQVTGQGHEQRITIPLSQLASILAQSVQGQKLGITINVDSNKTSDSVSSSPLTKPLDNALATDTSLGAEETVGVSDSHISVTTSSELTGVAPTVTLTTTATSNQKILSSLPMTTKASSLISPSKVNVKVVPSSGSSKPAVIITSPRGAIPSGTKFFVTKDAKSGLTSLVSSKPAQSVLKPSLTSAPLATASAVSSSLANQAQGSQTMTTTVTSPSSQASPAAPQTLQILSVESLTSDDPPLTSAEEDQGLSVGQNVTVESGQGDDAELFSSGAIVANESNFSSSPQKSSVEAEGSTSSKPVVMEQVTIDLRDLQGGNTNTDDTGQQYQFSCLWCKVDFSNKMELLHHFMQLHRDMLMVPGDGDATPGNQPPGQEDDDIHTLQFNTGSPDAQKRAKTVKVLLNKRKDPGAKGHEEGQGHKGRRGRRGEGTQKGAGRGANKGSLEDGDSQKAKYSLTSLIEALKDSIEKDKGRGPKIVDPQDLEEEEDEEEEGYLLPEGEDSVHEEEVALPEDFQVQVLTFEKDGKTLYKCGSCQKVFSKSCTMARHAMVHSRMMPYQCGLCDEKCSDMRVLLRHLDWHAEDVECPCPRCQKLHSDGSITKETKEKEGVTCDMCGEKFVCMRLMAKHRKTSHNIQVCPYCGAVVTHDISSHMTSHQGTFLYRCGLCTAGFNVRPQLHDHLKVHTQIGKEDGSSEEEGEEVGGDMGGRHRGKRKAEAEEKGDKSPEVKVKSPRGGGRKRGKAPVNQEEEKGPKTGDNTETVVMSPTRGRRAKPDVKSGTESESDSPSKKLLPRRSVERKCRWHDNDSVCGNCAPPKSGSKRVKGSGETPEAEVKAKVTRRDSGNMKSPATVRKSARNK